MHRTCEAGSISLRSAPLLCTRSRGEVSSASSKITGQRTCHWVLEPTRNRREPIQIRAGITRRPFNPQAAEIHQAPHHEWSGPDDAADRAGSPIRLLWALLVTIEYSPGRYRRWQPSAAAGETVAMLGTPFSPWPSFTQDEARAISRVLLSNRVNYWTGTECREFEREFAAWVGTTHAVALANGTVALDLALKALNIGSGDDVIVTPRSYVASASCVVTAGARPVFADVDSESQNITASTIRRVLTSRTRAIICVHLAGMPCEMDPIMALAQEHDLKVIEDCAQAHGARYRGRMVGGIGHIGAWSFCQDKIMTTGGEGGMVTTSDRSLWAAMWSYKDHGKSWEAVYDHKHPPGFRWLHESFGTNWRMLEMQAVIGRLQLNRMQ